MQARGRGWGAAAHQREGKGAGFTCGGVRSGPPSQPTSVSQGLISLKVSPWCVAIHLPAALWHLVSKISLSSSAAVMTTFSSWFSSTFSFPRATCHFELKSSN